MFQHIDILESNGYITAKELVNFMKSNYLRLSVEEANLIIKEYDANQDENLDFEEFCRMFLPSTNPIMKEIAINRSSIKERNQGALSNKVQVQLSEHIELELKLVKIKNEIKRQLLQKQDFTKANYFNLISNSKDKITVPDLINFIRKFGKANPRKEELEAILRRCDHEGDQLISYSEFCELVTSNEEGI